MVRFDVRQSLLTRRRRQALTSLVACELLEATFLRILINRMSYEVKPEKRSWNVSVYIIGGNKINESTDFLHLTHRQKIMNTCLSKHANHDERIAILLESLERLGTALPSYGQGHDP